MSDAGRYAVIDCNGYSKKVHFKGVPTAEELATLLVGKFKLDKNQAKLENLVISMSSNGEQINIRDFAKRKLMGQASRLIVTVKASRPVKVEKQSGMNGKHSSVGHFPMRFTKAPIKERSSYPAAMYKEDQLYGPGISGFMRQPSQEGITLKSSEMTSEAHPSIVHSQEEICRLVLRPMRPELIQRVLGRLNKVVVIHTVKSLKVMTNVIKLVPRSGKELPVLVYNKVKSHQDESLELNVNNEICLVLKINENLIQNLHIFIECLNAPNSSELLLKRFSVEPGSSNILSDPVFPDTFGAFIRDLGCSRNQFITMLRQTGGRVASQETLDFLLSACCDLYKHQTSRVLYAGLSNRQEAA